MWKRHRYLVLSVALTGVALAAYFEPTHCVRGWLWGEAFFDGRPTSYWRARCHDWLARFDSFDDAEFWAQGPLMVSGKNGRGEEVQVIVRNVSTLEAIWVVDGVPVPCHEMGPRPLTNLQSWSRCFLKPKHPKLEDHSPDVLWGLPEAEPVMQELAHDEKLQRFARNGLVRAKIYRR